MYCLMKMQNKPYVVAIMRPWKEVIVPEAFYNLHNVFPTGSHQPAQSTYYILLPQFLRTKWLDKWRGVLGSMLDNRQVWCMW